MTDSAVPAQGRACALPQPSLVVCGECDAVYQRPVLASRDVARCRRCGAVLGRGHFLRADGQAALALASLVTFFIASLSPIVDLELQGVRTTATLWQATRLTWEAGEPGVALLSAATAFVFPLAVILLRLWVLMPLALRPAAAVDMPRLVPALRALHVLLRWSMVEVFMLGVLIAVVRSAGATSIVLGPGLFAYAVLTVLLTALQASGLHGLWQMLRPEPAAPTAPAAALRHCACCGLVSAVAADAGAAACPRCGYTLHTRKPDSLQRTWAWLATAALLYVPANLLPVMTTQSVLGQGSHTLVGGIHELWVAGSWELAVIVFVASIAVPLLKMGALGLLAACARQRSRWRQVERARLYRLVETVGHWSMLDVFVVVLLVGMVHFGIIATVAPEVGLLAFGAVVVATMLAADAYDARLTWPDDDPTAR
ncbi:MAG: paraquat-inducible protein A [Aquabacterium sp.]